MASDYDSTEMVKELMEAVKNLPTSPPCPISLRVGAIVEALRRDDIYEWNAKVPHFKSCKDCQREINRIHKQRPIKLHKKRPVLDALCTALDAAAACMTYAAMRNNRK